MLLSNQCIVIPSPITPHQQQQQLRPISRGRSVRRYHSPLRNDGRSHSRKKRTSPTTSSSSDKQQQVVKQQQGQFDKNGCCIIHPTIQVAKKKLSVGSGYKYKLYRPCPNCLDCSDGLIRTGSTPRRLSAETDDTVPLDTLSICSKSSRKSTTSILSMGSAWSSKSKKSCCSSRSRRKGGNRGSSKDDKYYASPFDAQGYCHTHPSIKLAKKKSLLNGGGWKVIHDICPSCAVDKAAADAASTRSGRSRRSSRSRSRGRSRSRSRGHSRSSRRSSANSRGRRSSRSSSRSSRISDGGSYISGISGISSASGGSVTDLLSVSSSKSSSNRSGRKKKTRVEEMRYQDTNGKIGRYTGTVNDDLVPNGEGKMKYKDGSVWCGVWNEGSQVHGKLSKSASGGASAVQRKNSAGSCKQQEMNGAQRKNSAGTNSIPRKVNHQERNNQAPIQRKSSSGSFKPIRPPPPPPRRASTGGSGKNEPERKTQVSSSSSRNKPEQKTHTDDNNNYAKNQSSSTEEDDIIILVKHGSGATVVSDMQDSTTSWLNQNEALSSTSKANIMNRYKDYMAGMKIGEEVQLPMKIDEYGNGR